MNLTYQSRRNLTTHITYCFLTASAFTISSCTPGPLQVQSVQKGHLSVAVQFPVTKFQTKLIKPETRVIYAVVYGNGIDFENPEVSSAITPTSPQTTLSVPRGRQTVLGAAYDKNKNILTAGKSLVTVKNKTQATLELLPDFNIKLTPQELALLKNLKLDLPKEPESAVKASAKPIPNPKIDLQPLPARKPENISASAQPEKKDLPSPEASSQPVATQPAPTTSQPPSAVGIPVPGNVRFKDIRKTELTMTWEKSDGATKYDLFLNDNLVKSGVTNLEYTFTGLRSETEYQFGIRAGDEQSNSDQVVVSRRTANSTSGGSGSSSSIPTTPFVSTFSPALGAPGTVVTFNGLRLTGITTVQFNGFPATTINAISDTQLTATVPAGATTGPITLIGSGGSGSTGNYIPFDLPAVTGLNPPGGVSLTSVVVSGSGFTGVTSVTFNGEAANSFTINNDGQITATAPPCASSGVIQVTNPAGNASSTAWTSSACTIQAYAGDGAFASDNGPVSSASFAVPIGIEFDNAGNAYVADKFTQRIRKIGSDGNVTTYAGQYSSGNNNTCCGIFADGPASAAFFSSPIDIALDSAGNLYVGDSLNHRIRKIDTAGNVTTVAGGTPGFSDGVGTASRLLQPEGVDVDAAGNLYVGDRGNDRIRKIAVNTATGTVDSGSVVTTFAGDGVGGSIDGTFSSARFDGPIGVTLDSAGNIYTADFNSHNVRKIDTAAGTVVTLGGNGSGGSADGVGTGGAQFNLPAGVAVDSIGNVYVADFGTSKVRKIDTAGVVSTYAGNGSTTGALGTFTSGSFVNPGGVGFDSAGTLYVTEFQGHRIRKLIF